MRQLHRNNLVQLVDLRRRSSGRLSSLLSRESGYKPRGDQTNTRCRYANHVTPSYSVLRRM